MSRRTPAQVVFVAIFAVTAAAMAAGMPDSHTQPLLDGCQRSQSLILAGSTPEWVYVHSNDVRTARLAGDNTAGRRTIEGTAGTVRPAGEDIYLSHDFHDFNLMIDPDPAYEDVLGSGNLWPGAEAGVIEGEWEVGDIPLWAWPSNGDRVRASGDWTWDCGHWGNSAADPTGLSQLLVLDPVETLQDLIAPGAIRGETTELHPLYEVSTFHANAAGFLAGQRNATRLSRLDVWINGYGGASHSIVECALKGITNWVLARALCSPVRDVGGPYSFTIPPTPKPSPASRLVVNPVIVHDETDSALRTVPVTAVPDPATGAVTVSFELPHAPAPQRFGITVEAGWTKDVAAVRHRISLDSIHIERSLDGASEPNLNPAGAAGEQTPEPGDWVLYASAGGSWIRLPLYEVTDDQTIPLGITFDLWLPPGVTPKLYVSGHECDEPLMDCRREAYGAVAQPLEFLELGFNDRPGRIEHLGAGVPLVAGTNSYHPVANPDPGSGFEDFSDAVCGPDACYQLTATWTSG
ncbi:MAG: hypothetical protein WEB06_08475 [Actinomycetota bacterium]